MIGAYHTTLETTVPQLHPDARAQYDRLTASGEWKALTVAENALISAGAWKGKVPRSLRRRLPVVESEGEIAWVAGVALSGLFRITGETAQAARLRALHEPGASFDPGT